MGDKGKDKQVKTDNDVQKGPSMDPKTAPDTERQKAGGSQQQHKGPGVQ